MCRYRVNQHLLGINLYSVFHGENFTQSKCGVKYFNTVKSTTQQVSIFKSNRVFGRKHSKANQLQKTIEYKTDRLSTKYSN